MCDLKWLENGLCLGNFFSSKQGCHSLWMSTGYRKRMALRSGEPELRANSDKGKVSGRRYHPFSLSKPPEHEKTPKYFLPDAARFPKEHCIYKVPKFRPFALLKRATCTWRVWGTVGMTDTKVWYHYAGWSSASACIRIHHPSRTTP